MQRKVLLFFTWPVVVASRPLVPALVSLVMPDTEHPDLEELVSFVQGDTADGEVEYEVQGDYLYWKFRLVETLTDHRSTRLRALEQSINQDVSSIPYLVPSSRFRQGLRKPSTSPPS